MHTSRGHIQDKDQLGSDGFFFPSCAKGTEHGVVRFRHSCGHSHLKLSKLRAALKIQTPKMCIACSGTVDEAFDHVNVYHVDDTVYHVAVYQFLV